MNYTIGDGMASIALVAGIVGYFHISHRSRQRKLEIIHEERMAAMEKGIPLPEFPLEEKRPEDDPPVLPIMGIVLSTLAIGAMIVLYFNLPASTHSFWIAPLPFAFLGVGLFVFHFLMGDSRRSR